MFEVWRAGTADAVCHGVAVGDAVGNAYEL